MCPFGLLSGVLESVGFELEGGGVLGRCPNLGVVETDRCLGLDLKPYRELHSIGGAEVREHFVVDGLEVERVLGGSSRGARTR